MKSRTVVIVLICMALTANPTQANIFDDIFGRIVSQKANTDTVYFANSIPSITFDSFMENMYLLNTPKGVQNLNIEMNNYNIHALKVRLHKTPWYTDDTFYVVKDVGILRNYDQFGQSNADYFVDLTYNQVMKIYPYIYDGELDFFDRWMLYAIYKMG